MPTSIEWTDERWNLADGVSEECCDLCYADPAEHGEQQFRRERLRELANRRRRITQGDLAYFERFPYRTYRVREADCAEIEHAELTGGGRLGQRDPDAGADPRRRGADNLRRS